MLATLRLCLFYYQAAICLGTDLQWKVFPPGICASSLRCICNHATEQLCRCGTKREIFNALFLWFTWAQNPLTPRRTIFCNRLENLICYFCSCYFSVCILLVLECLHPFSFAKGHLPFSSPIIKYCFGKPIWRQWGFCATSFVYHWPVNVTKHSFWFGLTPFLFLSQTAPGPERMAESDSDSNQVSTNDNQSRWVHKAHTGNPGSRKCSIFFLCRQL